MTTRSEQLTKIQKEAFELFLQKNTDYGDAFANYGPIGVLVRLGDKIQRLQHISKSEVSLVKSESLRDTLIDLHNYAAMAVMLLDESPDAFNKITTTKPRTARQLILTNSNSNSESSISETETESGDPSEYYVGTPRIDNEDYIEREYMTEHPYMLPQENGGRCSIS